MIDIRFRRARRGDVAAIVRLLADDTLGAAREDLSDPLHPAYAVAFEAIDRDPNQLLMVAVRGGDLIGCFQITFIPGLSRKGSWRGQIESVRVSAPERGRGVGRSMFEWAIAECRRRGCSIVQLTTDKCRTDARRFYESLGFRPTHEGMKLAL